MTDLPEPRDLAAAYLARVEHNPTQGPKPIFPFNPFALWEEWIQSDPDRAWQVFLEIVRLRPADDDTLEQVARRIELLLECHWEFLGRVKALLAENARLTRIVPRRALTRAHYLPRYRSLEELAEIWLTHHRQKLAHEVRDLIRADPAQGLAVALELIQRAPLYEFTSYDVMDPLLDLLRQHGAEVIEAVEGAAEESIAVRRVLWRMRRQQRTPPGPYDVPEPIWNRVLAAARDTTEYNTEEPPGARSPLPYDLEALIDPWFTYEQTFWAWTTVNDLVHEDPERGWEVILLLVARSDDDALGAIGAGPLEDLIRLHHHTFVGRIEAEASRHTAFRAALAGVWISLADVPADLADRFYQASGGELQILDRLDEMPPPDSA